jgi:hypothetical protein
VRSVPTLVGTSPRWLGLARVTRPDNSSVNSTAILLVIDSDREKEIGLGRTWTHRKLGASEAHISSVILRRIGVEANANQNASLVVDLLGLASQIAGFDASDPIALIRTFSQAGGSGALPGDQSGADWTRVRNFTLASVVSRVNNATGQNFTVEALTRYLYNAFGVQVPANINFSRPLIELAWETVRDSLVLRRNVTVIDNLDSPDGKFPKALGNVLVVERDFLHSIIAAPIANMVAAIRALQNSPLRLAAEFALNISDASVQDLFSQVSAGLERAENFEIDHFALTVVGMYTERLRSYVGTKDSIDIDMIHFTNAVGDAIGYGESIAMQTTLATAMGALYFVRLFLDQIFTFASIVLIGLGAMLIYSLLLSNVEEKTYEYGMLRAQGMRQHVLIELLLIQSFLFAIPGILLGLLAAFLIYLPLEAVVNVYVNVPYNALMSGQAVGIGIAVGLLMPIVANVGPISRALQRSLRDSLDKYHSENDAVKVTIIALAKVGLAPWQVVLAVLMIVMGFVVYYLMPYSFIFNDIPLFLFLLTIILLGMLLGLSLVAQVLQPSFERVMSWLYMWGGERRRLRPLVLKGLHAHRRRNRKTAVMFTTALAFIIFVGTSFSLQEHSIADNIELGVGAEIAVLSLSERYPVNKDAMAEYLELRDCAPSPRRQRRLRARLLVPDVRAGEVSVHQPHRAVEPRRLSDAALPHCRHRGALCRAVVRQVLPAVRGGERRDVQHDAQRPARHRAGPVHQRRQAAPADRVAPRAGRRAARGRLAGRRRRRRRVWRLAHRRLLAQPAQRRRVQHLHRRRRERGGAFARRDRHRDAAAAHGALQS